MEDFLVLLYLSILAVGSFAFLWLIERKNLKMQKEKFNQTFDKLSNSEQKCQDIETQLREQTLVASEYKTKYEEFKIHSEEKLKLIEESQKTLKESFKMLSVEALEKNNSQFLNLAKEAFEKTQEKVTGDLDKKKDVIKEMFAPIKESMYKMGEGMQKLEKERKADQEGLKERLSLMISQEKELKKETQALTRALRTPNIRGRWGEIQLKRVAELSGMINHCDFVEQKQDQEEGRSRPDMIVYLPGGRNVIVDAKTPFEAYLDAMQTTDEDIKASKLKSHAKHVRSHILGLGKKSYFEKFEQTPEFVVLFLPSEGFFSAALEEDPSLIEIGVDQNVIIATPMTLIGLLRAIAYGWKQEKLSQSAKEIALLGKELYKRLLDMQGHMQKLGKSINSSVETYNKMVGSYESRVMVSGRKFQKLGIGIEDELEPSKLLEQMPRELISKDDS